MPYADLRKGRFSGTGHVYLVTTVTHCRHPWFLDFACARCLVEEMRRLHEVGWVDSLAWVLMPDHLHWLLALERAPDLARVMGRVKGRSARRVNDLCGRAGRVWQESYHDRALRREEDLVAMARYVVANPLRAGLVERLGDYPHWDARWL